MMPANLNGLACRSAFKRPLVTISTALSLIGVDYPEQIIALIQGGQLRWAFDVSTKRSKRREIRILGESINEYLAGHPATEQQDFNVVMKAVFPEPKWAVPAFDIACAWNLSSTHFLALCRSTPREINLVKGIEGRCRRGPGGSPLVEVGSAIAFLRRRRVL